jgi:V-type H+-transporting ATPase subunit a
MSALKVITLNGFYVISLRKYLNIWAEFIPQILFLCCVFGYLALLMFIKWAKYYANSDPDTFDHSERCAPSILITFINMMLNRANVAPPSCGDPYLFPGERGFQGALVM